MVNTDELKGLFAKKGYSQRQVAKLIGMSEKTFYRKMKKRKFGSNEIERLVEALELDIYKDNVIDIFFDIK